jgi:Asp/Glu/hydantoin racemase
MTILRGGFPVYGIPVGIIMLECAFARPVGDIGNALTFPYPVQYEVLEGIASEDLIRHETQPAVTALVAAGKRLERKGVKGILTSCGLLIKYQRLLAEALSVPVATSSLLLIPFLDALLPPNQKIGVITADSQILSPEVVTQAGSIRGDRIIIKGAQNCDAFNKAIMAASPPYELDTDRLKAETISLCRELLREEPDTGAIILECTNLAPYRSELTKTFSIPVFDIIQVAHLIHAGTAV